jgi:hypothetical protein
MKLHLGMEVGLNLDFGFELHTLTTQEFEALKEWEQNRLVGPHNFRMLPAPYRLGQMAITEEQARQSEDQTDGWMTGYALMEVLNYKREKSDRGIHAGEPEEYCVEIGLGTGRGLGYITAALDLGLTVQLYDWAKPALEDACYVLGLHLCEPPDSSTIRNIVKWGEARRLLCGPRPLNHKQIRILKLSTLLEHIGYKFPAEERIKAVEEVCAGIGKILYYPENRVIIMNTPPQGNEGIERHGSLALDDDWIHEKIQASVFRKILVTKEKEHKSLTSRFTARTYRSE